ncbi:unnamed protein product [Chrysoparadoxa australica]
MLLRDKDFICNGTDEPSASTVKGFAAPVRDVSREQIVPDGWSNGAAASTPCVSFRYRREDAAGKTFLLKVVQVGENEASAYLAESNGQTESLSLTLSDFADCLAAEDTIAAARSQFEDKCIKPFLPAPDAKQASTAPSTKEVTNTRRDEHDQDPLRVGPPRMPGPVPIPGMGPASPYPVHPGAIPGGVPGLGRGGDFNGDLMPGGPGLGPGMPGMTGGGLMGPDHPAFGGSGGSGLLPQPRFDPYGPPMPGIPGPGGLGRGRGGGRGNGNRFGGDPDPDHLPPPGAPGGAGGMGNMFF